MRINHFIAPPRQPLAVKRRKNHENYDIDMPCNRRKRDEEEVKKLYPRNTIV